MYAAGEMVEWLGAVITRAKCACFINYLAHWVRAGA